MAAYITRMAGQKVITCSSIHAEKGMEWNHVFVLGLTDGVMPDRRYLNGDRLAEERRLLYVAVTRARKLVWLCHSPVKVSGVRRL
jgi:DNA helicase-2/ATP-dependent DNA helicase PcrA